MKATGRAQFKSFKPVIMIIAAIIGFLPRFLRILFLRILRNVDGRLGLALRYVFVRSLAKSCGDNVSIKAGVFLLNVDEIEFGNNVSVHPMCYLDGSGGISISDNVSIAHGCSILSTNHTWELAGVPIKYNPEVRAPVRIENDVWVGCGVRILAGSVIGPRSVVAAGAVVTKSFPGGSIYGGVPAKEIKRL